MKSRGYSSKTKNQNDFFLYYSLVHELRRRTVSLKRLQTLAVKGNDSNFAFNGEKKRKVNRDQTTDYRRERQLPTEWTPVWTWCFYIYHS
jgi:hypothetical protein